MRIMTFNIWGDYFQNPVSQRDEKAAGVIRSYAPDIVGFQEVTRGWYAGRLFPQLLKEGYDLAGTELCGNRYNNYVPLAYKRDKFCLRAKGYEMLDDTPDESKAVTWAYLEAKSGERLAVCNTHFWWKSGPEHDLIREKNALQLANLMRYLSEKHRCPVFAFGDMNCCPDSAAFGKYAENGITPLRQIAETASPVGSLHTNPVLCEDGLFRGAPNGADASKSIDHIVVRGEGVKVSSYLLVEDPVVFEISDHYPVYADFTL